MSVIISAVFALSYWASDSFDLKRHILAQPDSLIVITDFDLTLTSGNSHECHDILGKSPLMPEAVRRDFNRLLDFSFPLEPPLDGDGWWVRANEVLISNGVPHKDDLTKIVAEAPVRLRPGARLLLKRLAKLGVPVLVVSAGYTEVITTFLEAQGAMYPNIQVSSNSLVWHDVTGVLSTVLPEPPVTSFNKGTFDLFLLLNHRTLALVLCALLGTK